MAETPVERLRRELRELESKREKKLIDDEQYFSDLEYIRNRLREQQEYEVQVPYEPGKEAEQKFYEVQDKLAGDEVSLPYSYMDEYIKKGVDPEKAYEMGIRDVQKKTRSSRYGTGEPFVEEVSPSFGVSNIVDPVKGLIEDPDTGVIRKATTGEMLYSSLFERQRKPTQLTTREAIEQYERRAQKIKRTKIQQKKAEKKNRPAPPSSTAGLFGVEVEVPVYEVKEPTLTKKELAEIDKEVEEEMLSQVDVSQAPSAPAVIAESGLERGGRILNVVSAILDPLVLDPVQSIVGTITGAPVSVRKSRYKKAEMDKFGGQVLTNLLTGQGTFDKLQASLLPPDEKASGLDYWMTEGTFGSMAISMMPALIEPATPYPFVKGAAKGLGKAIRATSKSPLSQTIARTVESPVGQILYAGRKAQVNESLKSVGVKDGAAYIEKKIAENGGVIDRPTLRKKAAEAVGDQYAIHENAKDILKKTDDGAMVSIDDFANPTNGYVKSIFKGAKEVPVEDVRKVVDAMEEVFQGLLPGKKGEKNNHA